MVTRLSPSVPKPDRLLSSGCGKEWFGKAQKDPRHIGIRRQLERYNEPPPPQYTNVVSRRGCTQIGPPCTQITAQTRILGHARSVPLERRAESPGTEEIPHILEAPAEA